MDVWHRATARMTTEQAKDRVAGIVVVLLALLATVAAVGVVASWVLVIVLGVGRIVEAVT